MGKEKINREGRRGAGSRERETRKIGYLRDKETSSASAYSLTWKEGKVLSHWRSFKIKDYLNSLKKRGNTLSNKQRLNGPMNNKWVKPQKAFCISGLEK